MGQQSLPPQCGLVAIVEWNRHCIRKALEATSLGCTFSLPSSHSKRRFVPTPITFVKKKNIWKARELSQAKNMNIIIIMNIININ